MVPVYTLAGLLLTAAVCFLVPVGLIIYSLRKNKGQRLFILVIFGFATLLVATNVNAVFMSLPPFFQLSENYVPLYFLAGAAAIGLFEAAARYFTVNYAVKLGGGYNKGFTAGVGLGAGVVLMEAMNYVQFFSQAQMINNGTFAKMALEQNVLNAQEITEYQNRIAAFHPMEFYVTALDRGVMVLIEIALALLLLKFIVEGRKIAGILITVGVRAAYEFLYKIFYFAPTEHLNNYLNESTAKILNLAVVLLFGAAAVYCIYRLKDKIPEVSPTLRPRTQAARAVRESETRKKSNTWQQVRQMNLKNVGTDDGRADEAVNLDTIVNLEKAHGYENKQPEATEDETK